MRPSSPSEQETSTADLLNPQIPRRMPIVGFMDSPIFDAHDPGPEHPESAQRLRTIRATLRARDLDIAVEHSTPSPIDRMSLERVHSPEYVARLKQACDHSQALDDDTAVSPRSFEAALLAAGAAAEAVRNVLEGTWDRAFCNVRPPGHHAHRDAAGGFCLFNNVVIAAEVARSLGIHAIAILDFDAHRGDGTQALCAGQDEILYLSWHQDRLYPDDDAPSPSSGGAKLCALPAEATAKDFIAVWRSRLLPELERFNPELVLLSAGFDADRRDPLSDLAMDAPGYYQLTAEIVDFANRKSGGKIVSVLEGGYEPEALARDVAAHIEALLERPYFVP